MNPLKVALGFVPFVLFSLLAPLIGGAFAAVAGLGAAVVLIALTARGGVKSLPVAQAVILLVMAVVGLIGGGLVNPGLVKYGPAIAAVLMGAFMIETARARPFTAQLSRSEVPPELWQDSRFRDGFLDVNRRISTAWGLAVLVVGLCHVLGALIGVENMNLLVRLAVQWGVPLFAFKQAVDYTKHAVAAAQGQQHELRERNAS